jgi:hypothetical protein
VRVDWKRQHNEEFYDVFCTQNTVFLQGSVQEWDGQCMWKVLGKKMCTKGVERAT